MPMWPNCCTKYPQTHIKRTLPYGYPLSFVIVFQLKLVLSTGTEQRAQHADRAQEVQPGIEAEDRARNHPSG
jgi:hypothetical protein